MNRAVSVSDLSYVANSQSTPLREGILMAVDHLDDVDEVLPQSLEVIPRHQLSSNGPAPDRSGSSTSLSNVANVCVGSTEGFEPKRISW